MRNRSLTGPIILIALGGIFLLNNFFPGISLWSFRRYWPFLIIGIGVLQLVEVLAAAGSGRPLPNRTRGGGGGFGILIAIIVLGAIFANNRSHWQLGRLQGGSVQIFGEQYEFPVSAKGDASQVKTLVLDNLRGNVTVTGTDDTRFQVDGRKSVRAYNQSEADDTDRRTQLRFLPEGNQLIVRMDVNQVSSDRRLSADLEIRVPRGVSVEARGRSGDLSVTAISGSVDVASDRGDIRLTDVGGNARVDVAHSGLVRLVNIKGTVDLDGKGNDVQVQDAEGQVTIHGSYSGTLEFKNLAKPMHFESNQTDLRIERVAGTFTMDLGDIRASNLIGPVRVKTKSRDIHIEGFTDALELELERGDIELTPGRLPLGKMDIHSHNGDVELTLPDRVAFDLRANTSQGEAHNDYGPAVRMEVNGRAASLRSVQSTGAPISISTDRGAVTVKKS